MNLKIASVFLAALPVLAYQAAQPQANQPKISDAQRQALMKMQTDAQAQKWSDVLADASGIMENFPDSPYKQNVLYMAFQAAGNANSYDQLVVWGERIIQANPNDIFARVQLADAGADHIRENDLDKDQAVKKVEDYAHQALNILQSATAPPAGLPVDPAQWPQMKQDLTNRSYYALGVAAMAKKNYPDAVKNFNTAIQTDPTNEFYFKRLETAYIQNKQYDDAIAAAQKAIDNPTSPAPLKESAEKFKQQATSLKGSAK
jgi:tetratricopeptide (TPR) repeat protein